MVNVELSGILWAHRHTCLCDQIREDVDIAELLGGDDGMNGPSHISNGAHILAGRAIGHGIGDFVQDGERLLTSLFVSLVYGMNILKQKGDDEIIHLYNVASVEPKIEEVLSSQEQLTAKGNHEVSSISNLFLLKSD